MASSAARVSQPRLLLGVINTRGGLSDACFATWVLSLLQIWIYCCKRLQAGLLVVDHIHTCLNVSSAKRYPTDFHHVMCCCHAFSSSVQAVPGYAILNQVRVFIDKSFQVTKRLSNLPPAGPLAFLKRLATPLARFLLVSQTQVVMFVISARMTDTHLNRSCLNLWPGRAHASCSGDRLCST